MGVKSAVVIWRTVAVLALVFILVCLALEIAHGKSLVELFECKAAESVKCARFKAGAMFLMIVAILFCILFAQIDISNCDRTGRFRALYSSSAFQTVAIIAFFFSWWACVSAILVYMIGDAEQFPDLMGLISLFVTNTTFEDSLRHNDAHEARYGVLCAAGSLSVSGVALGIIGYLGFVHGGNSKRRFQSQTSSRDVEVWL
ncbi:uncharacterized protein LOC141656042 [Silene latifolia]|uniref:uncharacterized protein LOC141656042 n=1 Tax=Silene latifolia TaxID=37657 RepID=UPI003D76D945